VRGIAMALGNFLPRKLLILLDEISRRFIRRRTFVILYAIDFIGFLMVPRDRIELPTRGFSIRI
jgi:hypothetical protein